MFINRNMCLVTARTVLGEHLCCLVFSNSPSFMGLSWAKGRHSLLSMSEFSSRTNQSTRHAHPLPHHD